MKREPSYVCATLALGCIDIYGWAALRAKIGPDEAEAEGFGGSKVEADNEV